MKDQLTQLCKKYALDSLLTKLESLNEQKVHVGFLGEFSSGKSSMINALLGAKVLPVMIQPTTKSVTEIEPIDGIDERDYFKQDEKDEWERIDASTFSAIAMGKESGKVKVKIQTNEYLKSNYVFVDTPGLSSLDDMDTDITFGYLPLLDGAVIMQDINQGGLTKSIVDFLTNPLIRPIINNFMFVLSKKDDKSEEAASAIVANVITTLQSLNATHQCGFTDIENRVIAISAKQAMTDGSLNELDPFKRTMEHIIVQRFDEIKRDRQNKETLVIAAKLKLALEDNIENIGLDDHEFKQKESTLKQDLEQLEKEKEKTLRNLDSMKTNLSKNLKLVAQEYLPRLQSVDTEEVSQLSAALSQEMSEVSMQSVRQYFKELEVLPFATKGISSIENTVKVAIKAKDYSVLVSTAIATAWFAPGATGAANAAEATGGAAVRQIGREAAKQVAVSTGMQILAGVGKLIKDINPLEYAGEYLKSQYLALSLSDSLQDVESNTAYAVYSQIKNELDNDIFEPLEKEIALKQSAIEESRAMRQKQKTEIEQYKDKVFNDLLIVKEIIKKES